MKRTRKSDVEPLSGAAGQCLMMSFPAPSHLVLAVCVQNQSQLVSVV